MLPLVNDAFKTLKPYEPGKPTSETERELGISGVIKLASNENPLGPSPKALDAMRAQLELLHEYPDGGAYYLKQALSEFHNMDPHHFILGNGSNEVIEMLIRTCVRPGENVVIGHPSFVAYGLCAKAAGVTVHAIPLDEALRYDLNAMAHAVDAQTKLIFLANPNNPTGTCITQDELDSFVQHIGSDPILVLDEAYIEYVSAPDYAQGLPMVAKRPRTMVLRTFSKVYGLAGLRVGYGIGELELVDFLNRGREPFNVNTLAQVAAAAALKDQDHVKRCCELNAKERQQLTETLGGLGYKVTPSEANFVLVDFGRSGREVFEFLLHRGIIVRPMAGFGLEHAVRITVGTAEQNERLVQNLRELS